MNEETNDVLSELSTVIPKWSERDDIKLLYSMFNLKPVGLHKHFYMCEIINNFNEAQKSEGLPLVTPDTIWTRLNELYELKLLEEYEPLPQSVLEEVDFDKFIEQQIKLSEDSDEDKPLANILMRSESEESKVSGLELDNEDSNSSKGPKNARKKSMKVEENVSSEEEPTTKSLRSRGRGSTIRKSKSPVVAKKRK
ncbi:hypothetical protein WDU94_004671 [Cyamophila willieti]